MAKRPPTAHSPSHALITFCAYYGIKHLSYHPLTLNVSKFLSAKIEPFIYVGTPYNVAPFCGNLAVNTWRLFLLLITWIHPPLLLVQWDDSRILRIHQRYSLRYLIVVKTTAPESHCEANNGQERQEDQ